MKKIHEKFASLIIYLFCFLVVLELGVSYSSFYFLFPIKNAKSFGYISKKSGETVIPLNKYSSRLKAQLALPFELTKNALILNKELKLSYDNSTNKFGYKDKNDKLVIDYKYSEARGFEFGYAIVAINKNNSKKFGTIDKNGNWIIEPKYSYLCSFSKYYTRACVDSEHCGVIDRFGSEVALMSYNAHKLNCTDKNCEIKFCSIGQNNNSSCNYFL